MDKYLDKALIGVAIIFSVLVYIMYKDFYPTPIYKFNDCVRKVYPAGEFTPKEMAGNLYQVQRIGSKNYLLTSFNVDNGYVSPTYSYFTELSIRYIQSDFVQVDCDTGEEL